MKKVALISGANKGIGLATARSLGKVGVTVLVGARDEGKGLMAVSQLRAEGIDAHFVPVDMKNPSAFAELAEHIRNEFGQLDILINNAGISVDKGIPATDVSGVILRETFEVNVFSQFELTQAMLPLLRASAAGRIVNLSSILGSITYNADPNSSFGEWRNLAYNSSKAALNAITAILSVALGGTNIKVNAAHPGWVRTDLGGLDAPLSVETGAETSVRLALLPEDGPTGKFFHLDKELPW